jgi:branched-chain amino acid transport system permease protein
VSGPPARTVAGTGWLLVLAAAVAVPWLLDPYTVGQVSRMLAVGLLAVAVAVLTGHAGLPTLGQVAPYAVGAYVTGLLARAGQAGVAGGPWLTLGPVQLLAAVGAAAVFALAVGLAVVRTRGVVCLMVTLAVGVLTATAAEQWRDVTGGSDGLFGIPATVPWPGGAPMLDDRHRYWYVLAVAAAAIAVTGVVLRSSAGTLLRGVRDNEARMRASGHPVTGYLLVAHVATGALAGAGGHLLVVTQRFVSPGEVGFEVAALVLLAVIVGGATSVAGAVAAAALVVGVREWAAAGVPGHGPLVLGLLFIAATFLLPAGGIADQLRRAASRLAATIDRIRLPGTGVPR